MRSCLGQGPPTPSQGTLRGASITCLCPTLVGSPGACAFAHTPFPSLGRSANALRPSAAPAPQTVSRCRSRLAHTARCQHTPSLAHLMPPLPEVPMPGQAPRTHFSASETVANPTVRQAHLRMRVVSSADALSPFGSPQKSAESFRRLRYPEKYGPFWGGRFGVRPGVTRRPGGGQDRRSRSNKKSIFFFCR